MITVKRDRRRTARRGAALVEMALVLPIFVAVTLGIVEFGRAMMVGNLVTNAAREGARLAIIDGTTNSQVETTIRDFLLASANAAPGDVTVTITITPYAGNPDPGNQVANCNSRDLVNVQVQLPYNKVSYIKPQFLDGKQLTGSAAMRHE
ncbi:MAG TPA: TadE/TadG family type IV pilus assembly protein [Planctomycetaceae bacterium]|nr:TadE/TadG family type IV pilus assembly protein [Planctomycetaceae bacterium]